MYRLVIEIYTFADDQAVLAEGVVNYMMIKLIKEYLACDLEINAEKILYITIGNDSKQ